MNNQYLLLKYQGSAFHAYHSKNDYNTRLLDKELLDFNPLEAMERVALDNDKARVAQLTKQLDDAKFKIEALEAQVSTQEKRIESHVKYIEKITGTVHWHRPSASCNTQNIYSPLVTTVDPNDVTCQSCRKKAYRES